MFHKIKNNPEDYDGKVIKYPGTYTKDGYKQYDNVIVDCAMCYMKVQNPNEAKDFVSHLGFDVDFPGDFKEGQTLTIIGVYEQGKVPFRWTILPVDQRLLY